MRLSWRRWRGDVDGVTDGSETLAQGRTPPQAVEWSSAPVHQLLHLQRDAATPLYQQIEQQLTSLIARGSLAPGAVLPAERQLAQLLGISRGTVQQCYTSLRERGLIGGHGRHGSIVQAPGTKVTPGLDRLRGFTEEIEQLGRKPSTRVLEREIVTDRAIASIFELPSESQFLKLVRVRLADGVPLSLESAWYSLQAAPALTEIDPSGSVYRQLANHGRPLAYCDQTIEPVLPTEEEAQVFDFQTPIPCLLIKRRSYLRAGPMVEYVEGVFRGDTYVHRLRLEV